MLKLYLQVDVSAAAAGHTADAEPAASAGEPAAADQADSALGHWSACSSSCRCRWMSSPPAAGGGGGSAEGEHRKMGQGRAWRAETAWPTGSSQTGTVDRSPTAPPCKQKTTS